MPEDDPSSSTNLNAEGSKSTNSKPLQKPSVNVGRLRKKKPKKQRQKFCDDDDAAFEAKLKQKFLSKKDSSRKGNKSGTIQQKSV